MNQRRKNFPINFSDEEWAFYARGLTLTAEQVPQRVYPLREIF